MKNKLTVAIAIYNEEKNIAGCLDSVKSLADEIIIVDGSSTDKTVEIAKTYNARVIITDNPKIFHINKQKAIDLATNEWILQLDADERVTPELSSEIINILTSNDEQIEEYEENLPNKKLFLKHQEQVDVRDGSVGGKTGSYNAFYIPRLNYFLGKYLKYGGVYPDGVIRLIRRGKAYLPCKSVHEQMVVNGRVGWLQHDLLHMADTSFERYLQRNSRYIDLIRDELKRDKVDKNIIQIVNYFIFKPVYWFFLTQIRHKGILDGFQGLTFSFFSALRYPRAYFRYITKP
ncbi:MAG: glycosyltransferase family 2 protein [Candidatus Daviesbacteria bacterium]|nr:glycosyltransferase family 2 protein [Candidatus Daviesbacteria bacterium]